MIYFTAHTHSNVCATVEGQCLEYLVYITLEQVRHFFLGFGSNPVRGFHFHRIQLRIFWIKIELKIIFRVSVLTPELRILKISKGDSNII